MPLRAFVIALQFLTRLPVRLKTAPDERLIAASALAYPWVGLLIGVLLACLCEFMSWFFPQLLPISVVAFIVLLIWVGITGGLHLDGFADSVDAWAAGGDRDRALAVMKDPSCGPAAVVALVLLLLGKFVLLTGCSQAWVLALIPMQARASLLLLFMISPYVRPRGLGDAISRFLPRRGAWLTLGAAIVVSFVFAPFSGHAIGLALTYIAGSWLLAGAVLMAVRALAIKWLGGITGDVAGALVEISELVLLLGWVAVLSLSGSAMFVMK